MSECKCKTSKTAFWSNLGEGLGFFLVCLGIGSCCYLSDGPQDGTRDLNKAKAETQLT